jgi:hypothetical protein
MRRVKAARRGIGPNVEMMIDAHGSLEVATAIKPAKQLEPYDIAWFEEPVSPDDRVGQAEVRQSTTIPVASMLPRGSASSRPRGRYDGDPAYCSADLGARRASRAARLG